jgi:hypothetical protein
MKYLILGFIIICTVGIVFNFTMKYKTLHKMLKDRKDGQS